MAVLGFIATLAVGVRLGVGGRVATRVGTVVGGMPSVCVAVETRVVAFSNCVDVLTGVANGLCAVAGLTGATVFAGIAVEVRLANGDSTVVRDAVDIGWGCVQPVRPRSSTSMNTKERPTYHNSSQTYVSIL